MDTAGTADPQPGDPDPTGLRTSLVVLWSCVAFFVTSVLLLLAADTAVYDGTHPDDTGPFDGVTAFFVVAAAVVFGAVPLVLAVVHSSIAVRRRWTRTRPTALRVAVYTAGCGLATAPFYVLGTYQTAQERRVTDSALLQAYVLEGSTALVGLLPLALYLLLRLASAAARNPR